MKKIFLAISLVLSSFNFIGTPAHADDSQSSNIKTDGTILYCQGMVCSTTPPAPATVAGFAVVNSEGEVKGAIACNIVSCPSTLQGTYMGCTNCALVQQTPATQNNNATGIISTLDRPVTYNPQTQVFTQGSSGVPTPITRTEVIGTTTLSATINSDSVTFSPNNTVNGEMIFTPNVTSNTGANVSATENGVTESQSFATPQTRNQIAVAVENKSLLQRRLDRIYVMLRGWVLD